MRFFLASALLVATGTRAQTPPPATAWNPDLTAALAQAKASQRPVLAVFSGSDWCKPCIMLKQEVFDQPEFAQYAQDKFVLARFDCSHNRENQLPPAQTKLSEQAAAQLNKEGTFPLVLLLLPEGKVLAKSGYCPGGPAAYNAYLSQLLTAR